jgi:hypothetical protein
MSVNATLGHQAQNAFIRVADGDDHVSSLLTGERKTEWDAATLADRQAAVEAVAGEVDALAWRGARLFDYQPFALPTEATSTTYRGTAGSGSDATTVVLTTLAGEPSHRLIGGAVHLSVDSDVDYGGAATVTAYDHATGELTVDDEFAESPAGKSVTVVTALPLAIRRALALQAGDYLTRRDAHELARKVHQGRTSSTGSPGAAETLHNVGGKIVWHPEAYWLVQPYLRRGVRGERE